jgi:hypothetical protein
MSIQTELILTLLLTVVLTSAIVWGAVWIKKNRARHPEIYRRRGIIGGALYVLLNLS